MTDAESVRWFSSKQEAEETFDEIVGNSLRTLVDWKQRQNEDIRTPLLTATLSLEEVGFSSDLGYKKLVVDFLNNEELIEYRWVLREMEIAE